MGILSKSSKFTIHYMHSPSLIKSNPFGLSDIPPRRQLRRVQVQIYTMDTYTLTKYDRWFDFVSTHQPTSPMGMESWAFLSSWFLDLLLWRISKPEFRVAQQLKLPVPYLHLLCCLISQPHPNQKYFWDNLCFVSSFFMSAYSVRVMLMHMALQRLHSNWRQDMWL